MGLFKEIGAGLPWVLRVTSSDYSWHSFPVYEKWVTAESPTGRRTDWGFLLQEKNKSFQMDEFLASAIFHCRPPEPSGIEASQQHTT